MSDEWKEENILSHKWQYRTLDGARFFGTFEGADNWSSRSDYPLRHFLWKTNRDAWAELHRLSLPEETVQLAVRALENELQALQHQIAEAELDDPERDFNRTLVETRTLELDADEVLVDGLDETRLQALAESAGIELEWDMVTSMFALLHVSDAVGQLDVGNLAMAGAHAIKALEWLRNGQYWRGRASDSWVQKRNLAMSGADAAHVENRRLRQRAIEIYSARTWPSKMQAARVISVEVHRTEMVVLRWIREHTRGQSSMVGATVPGQ